MAQDLEAGPHILQHLGNIFAQFTQSTATVRASLMGWHMRVDLARKMLGQRAAEGPAEGPGQCWTFGASHSLRFFE